MSLASLRIIVDERERKSGIPELLKSVGVNMEVKTLPIGDYIVAPETVVERKSLHDLVSSVFDGRLFDQCSRLKEHFQYPIILMEGNVDEIEEITENPLIFYGAVSRVAIDFKIPIIPTPSATHTAKLLVSMCSRKEGHQGPFLKKIKKSNDIQKQQLSSLTSLPGVG
ncbi:MAG: ERCC4 domain-containing protein, partial [Nitrosopumilaceae archaeon]|nr:ERCC4 domain-containing protein [Nitrosopumilaceae archaeon]